VTYVVPTFTGCDNYASASWAIVRSGKTYGRITAKHGVNQGSWRYQDSWPTGSYLLSPASSGAVPQNTARTVVKDGTRISLKGFRQDHLKVPLTGVISRYVASVDGFRRWPHRTVAISYRDCPTCVWHSLATDTTNASGVFSLAAVSEEVRYYRARIGDSTVWWGSTSNSVHY